MGDQMINDDRLCNCCGAPAYIRVRGRYARCRAHESRNPCAIEGCCRTTAASDGSLANDRYLCGEHWRVLVPPRSRPRRAYHAHFRRAKRLGWDEQRKRAYWLFWDSLVKMARRRAEGGFVEEAAINRIMGW